MDKYQALHTFFNSFNLKAYDETSVPSGKNQPALPYITYDMTVGDYGTTTTNHISLYYKSYSWGDITAKASEISKTIGLGGIQIPYDNGTLWIKKSSNFFQRMAEPNDDSIRRVLLTINVTSNGED